MGEEPQSLVASSPGSLRPLPTGLVGLGAERETASGLASQGPDGRFWECSETGCWGQLARTPESLYMGTRTPPSQAFTIPHTEEAPRGVENRASAPRRAGGWTHSESSHPLPVPLLPCAL